MRGLAKKHLFEALFLIPGAAQRLQLQLTLIRAVYSDELFNRSERGNSDIGPFTKKDGEVIIDAEGRHTQ